MTRAASSWAPAQAPQGAAPLPALRDDLVLHRATPGRDGGAAWQVYDPLRHRYIAIDDLTRRALACWREGITAEQLATALHRDARSAVSATDIEDLIRFVRAHGLLREVADGAWRRSFDAHRARRHSTLMSMLHNYLFFRVPLIAPDPFLARTAVLVAPLFSRIAHMIVAVLGLVGLSLASRQWDIVVADVQALLTLSGAAQFGLTLFVVKVFHELGHAYAAHRFGVRVPSMGVAFMMLAPILYTDVTDAWRLTDRRQRTIIDGAGIAVELGIACLATFLWVFTPDGVVRHLLLLLATTSWIMSLAINLNPFMRFDGYYIASDLLGIDNLQTRAFELGTWATREVLFGLGRPAPEMLSPGMQRTLIGYAWMTWLYRLVLFTGIALMVYHMVFKALGVVLFLFEIWYFIARPIGAELKTWWQLRSAIIRRRRVLVPLGLLLVATILLIVPWSTQVHAPAVIEASAGGRLYAPRPAAVVRVAVSNGTTVRQGELLVQLRVPELEHEQRIVAARLNALERRLAHAGGDRGELDNRQIVLETRAALQERLAGLAREMADLDIRAPFDGLVSDLDPSLHPGRWVRPTDLLAFVRHDHGLTVTAYVSQADVWRVSAGDHARFLAEVAGGTSAPAHVTSVAISNAARIDQVELHQASGGAIATHSDPRLGKHTPVASQYRITADVDVTASRPTTRQRGTLIISGQPQSLAAAIWRHVLMVLVRESGA